MESFVVLVFALCLLGSALAEGDNEGFKSERELRRDIFADYDKLVRPVRKYSNIVTASIGMNPLSLRELNEKTQVLTLDSWIKMMWTDEYLRWDPKDYDGITVFRIAPSEIWKPDVTVYTGLTDSPMMPTATMQALVYNNGSVIWVPPYTIRSRCAIPFTRVPKDVVECNIRFGSWTYGSDVMNIQLSDEKVDVSYFLDNNVHWKLVKVISDRQDRFYPCCKESYPFIDYNITLMRRWTSRHGDSSLGNGDLFS